MKKIVVLIGCLTIFTMVACADETAAGEQGNSDVTITSEETEQVRETVDEMVSENTETVSEEVLEPVVTGTEGTDAADEEAVSEEEVLEDSPITLMDTVLFAQRGVNVRSGPGTDYEKLGTLSTNQEVTVTGQDKESGWYQIEYNGTTAFVSDSYLGEHKVVVSAPVSNTGNNSAGTSGANNATAANTQTTTTNTQNSGTSSDYGFGYSQDALLNVWQNAQAYDEAMGQY